jgi:NADH-quinone oxidoreductase subunit C
MAEDTKQPNIPQAIEDASKPADVSTGQQVTGASQADAEKDSKVEEAKARVAAAKESITEKAAAAQPPGATKAPVKKKEEGPKPTDASGDRLVKRLKGKLNGAVIEATGFLGQLSIRIERSRIVEACDLLKRDSDTPFNYLSDVTCVHFPDRSEAPFEVVYNLYSISANERVRLKVATTDAEGVESVTSVWPAANWMEREVYDLFGVTFRNHPDLRRLLLPPDWEGHPLRKDYPLEFVENQWTKKHLPEMTEVQREQLEQRRAYGLEVLSVPQERMMREIFQGGKEVMPKDK